MAEEETRIERDSMGEVEVPAHAKWRAQTQRAIENFPISGAPLAPALIAALARIKAAVARLKVADGTIDRGVGDAIAEAADAVVRGEWDAEFPIDVFQSGSGVRSTPTTTSTTRCRRTTCSHRRSTSLRWPAFARTSSRRSSTLQKRWSVSATSSRT